MGYLSKLYKTYENLADTECDPPLMKIAQTTQNAQIEITINRNAELVDAKVVPKEDAVTLIPCTEKSAGRSGSHPIHHPLMDKLQYLAGDYTQYGGTKGSDFYEAYISDLEKWCLSEYRNEKVEVVYNYLKKGCLIHDLIDQRVLYIDEAGHLIEKWSAKEGRPEIYNVCIGDCSDSFVRIRVEESALWKDAGLQNDFIRYYLSSCEKNGFCYVTGTETYCSVNHPSKIRNTGDMAKLISANDSSGYTYRGRFLDETQAVQIGYEASQKAHNALKWLIKKQGKAYGDRIFVAWNPKGKQVPDCTEDSFDFLYADSIFQPYTGEEFAKSLNNKMSGYLGNLEYNEEIIILGLDAATPGRMAVVFYREFLNNDLIEKIKKWHLTTAWRHRYRFDSAKRPISFTGAPSPKDIAEAAFGIERGNFIEMDGKYRAEVIERILYCIVDGVPFPRDIAEAVYRKTCHPQNYSNKYNWEKVLSICCSVTRKFRYDQTKGKEDWTMELKKEEMNLDYLCGRMLAVADALEREAINDSRETNAMRYFTRFAEYPCKTWDVIMRSLIPYMSKVKYKDRYDKMLSEISGMIDADEFARAKHLDGRMALGFYSQKQEIYKKKSEEKDNSEEE